MTSMVVNTEDDETTIPGIEIQKVYHLVAISPLNIASDSDENMMRSFLTASLTFSRLSFSLSSFANAFLTSDS